jgi:hypothetical protein
LENYWWRQTQGSRAQASAVATPAISLGQAAGELDRVLDRHVHALAARGSDQVSRIPGQEHAAVLHRIAHAHPVVEDVPFGELAPLDRRLAGRGQALFQLRPSSHWP